VTNRIVSTSFGDVAALALMSALVVILARLMVAALNGLTG
jgi:hypothetical protein